MPNLSSLLGHAARAAAAVESAIRRAARRLSALTGRRRLAVAFAAGVAAALALAPVYATPLLFVAFPVLLWLMAPPTEKGGDARRRGWRRGFAVGWAFGFGYFLAGVYWLSLSLLVDAQSHAWLMPFALILIPGGLALFPAGACAIYARFAPMGAARILFFAVVYSLAEYARGHVLTGFPWNLTGQAFAGAAALAQSASIVGAYGLSFVVIALSAGPAAFADRTSSPARRGVVLAAPVLGLAGLALFGALRLAATPPVLRGDVLVTIVQPSLGQREKTDPARADENLERHIALSRLGEPPPPGKRRIVIWPENAAPVIFSYRPHHWLRLRTALAPGVALAFGGVRLEVDEGGRRFYNSLHVIDWRDGAPALAASYDKHHLAPFGEYVPLAGILSRLGLTALSAFAEGGLAAGDGPRIIDLGGGAPPFAPLICYEAVFPGALYPPGRRPEWLLNVTNDAWFGDSSGPRQHLDQARLRAIETGLPVARAANTGVSAMIGPAGRLLARLPLYARGAIETALPRPVPPTLYARLGDRAYFALLLAAAAAVAAAAAIQRRGRRRAREGARDWP